MGREADGIEPRPISDLNSIVVTCRDCERTRMIFPNEQASNTCADRPAAGLLSSLFCSGCRASGKDGKRVRTAPVWRTPDVEAGRERMARLLRPTRCGARL